MTTHSSNCFPSRSHIWLINKSQMSSIYVFNRNYCTNTHLFKQLSSLYQGKTGCAAVHCKEILEKPQKKKKKSFPQQSFRGGDSNMPKTAMSITLSIFRKWVCLKLLIWAFIYWTKPKSSGSNLLTATTPISPNFIPLCFSQDYPNSTIDTTGFENSFLYYKKDHNTRKHDICFYPLQQTREKQWICQFIIPSIRALVNSTTITRMKTKNW